MTDLPFVPSLETKAFGTPLLRFKAVLKEYTAERRKDEGSGREYMIINFDFIDLEVIESTEPYAFPVASIGIGYSTSEATRWDVLAKSIKGLFGRTPALDEIVGKTQEWKYDDCKLRTKDDADGQWKDLPAQAWKVISLDGIASAAETTADINDHILDLLDGKNEAEFNQAVFTDSKVRGHADIIESHTNRELLPNLEKAGRVHRDADGVWHKGEKPTS
jgi:hypothetical protein